MSELNYEVLVNDGLRRHREQTLPDGSPIVSSPVASTLIYGDHDAVLVDPPFTRDQVQRVGYQPDRLLLRVNRHTPLQVVERPQANPGRVGELLLR